MGRFWSLLFFLVPVLGVASFVWAAFIPQGILANVWMPVALSDDARAIDFLSNAVTLLLGIVFVGTGLALAWFIYRYDGKRAGNVQATYTHGHHRAELVWTVVPGVVLFVLAIWQMNEWAEAKILRPQLVGPDGDAETADDIPQPPLALVTGRQFEWVITYPGPDGILHTADDLPGEVNRLHVPVGETVVLQVESDDVLHSFFLPHLRLKNDLVPGMKQFVWFRADSAGEYDIVCAELCGWGHYKMKGRLFIQPPEEFTAYLQRLQQQHWERGET